MIGGLGTGNYSPPPVSRPAPVYNPFEDEKNFDGPNFSAPPPSQYPPPPGEQQGGYPGQQPPQPYPQTRYGQALPPVPEPQPQAAYNAYGAQTGYGQQQHLQQPQQQAVGGYGTQKQVQQPQQQQQPVGGYGAQAGYGQQQQLQQPQQQQVGGYGAQAGYGQQQQLQQPQQQQGAYPQPGYTQQPQQSGFYGQAAESTLPEAGHYGFRNESIRIQKILLHTTVDHPSIPHLRPNQITEDFQNPIIHTPFNVTPVSPKVLRATFNVLPGTKSLRDLVPLPIGICVNPLAGGRDIPVASFPGCKSMVRCGSCQSYINPFNVFTKNGSAFVCCVCRKVVSVPNEYYAPLDPNTSLRVDREARPELLHSCVELEVTPDFLKNPPRRPIMVLVLDCSHAAVQSGLLAAMCKGAMRALESLAKKEELYMGIMAYDSSVHLFRFMADQEPQMVTAPDIVTDTCHTDDKFIIDGVELPGNISDFVVRVKDFHQQLHLVLERLPVMVAGTAVVGCAVGPAINTAMTLLRSLGGKVVLSLSGNPTDGEGAIKQRFDPLKMAGAAKEYTMLQPGCEWFKERALSCSAVSMSVDLVVGVGAVAELGTVAPISLFTGGHIYHATGASMAGLPLTVERCLTRYIGFDSVMRIRCSEGISISSYYGHFHVREAHLLSFPVIDEDTGLGVELEFNSNFKGKFAYIQFATIYSTIDRERRIRLQTIQLRVGENLSNVINSIDGIGLCGLLTRICVDKARSGPFADARALITKKVTDTLRSVQMNLEMQGLGLVPTELNIPESMKFVPQILAAFFRYAAVGAGLNRFPILPCERLASMAMVMTTPPDSALAFYLGWSYALYNPGAPLEELPAPTLSSGLYFVENTVFLVHAGASLILWVGKRVDHHILEGLRINLPRSVEDMQSLQPRVNLTPVYERIKALASYLSTLGVAGYCPSVEVAPEGNSIYESVLTRYMNESPCETLVSYSDYLKKLRNDIAPSASTKK